MFAKKILAVALISTFFLSGCATIANGTNENFKFNSEPSNAQVKIVDKKNDRVLITKATPFNISLNKKEGYFEGKSYEVTVSKKGYKSVQFDIIPETGGWYIWGNLFSWGLSGWLIVDPLTGSMWNLVPEQVEQVDYEKHNITIKLIDELTAEQKSKMTKIK